METNVKLSVGDALSRCKDVVNIEDDRYYKRLTIRMNGRGVKLRDTQMGLEIGTKRQFRVELGQFILSKIDARNGAFGIVPDDCHKAIITGNFWTFDVDGDLLEKRYFELLTKTPAFVDFCVRASDGTTNRRYLDEERFLNQTIDVPSPDEQRCIVDKVESLSKKIGEAKRLREEILIDAQAMLRSAFQQIIEGAKFQPMSEVAPIVRRKVEIKMDSQYPELGVRSFGKGTFHKPVLNGIDVGTKKLYYINLGDLLFSNVFAWEGAIAVVDQRDEGRVGSHRFITCVPKQGITTSEFLCFYLLAGEGIEKIREASPGGAGRNRTLGLKKLEKIEVPIPSYDKQLWFNQLQAQVAAIHQSQTNNQTELDALLPSILDKAFKGDL
jgi:type I restriction enzyme S subunit